MKREGKSYIISAVIIILLCLQGRSLPELIDMGISASVQIIKGEFYRSYQRLQRFPEYKTFRAMDSTLPDSARIGLLSNSSIIFYLANYYLYPRKVFILKDHPTFLYRYYIQYVLTWDKEFTVLPKGTEPVMKWGNSRILYEIHTPGMTVSPIHNTIKYNISDKIMPKIFRSVLALTSIFSAGIIILRIVHWKLPAPASFLLISSYAWISGIVVICLILITLSILNIFWQSCHLLIAAIVLSCIGFLLFFFLLMMLQEGIYRFQNKTQEMANSISSCICIR